MSSNVAEDELKRFIESMDLELYTEGRPEKQAQALEKAKAVVVKAIQTGHITIDEAGLPTVHLKHPPPPGGLKTISFKRPTGSTIIAAQSPGVAPSTLMHELTGQPPAIFSKLDYRTDYTVIDMVASLFLG